MLNDYDRALLERENFQLVEKDEKWEARKEYKKFIIIINFFGYGFKIDVKPPKYHSRLYKENIRQLVHSYFSYSGQPTEKGIEFYLYDQENNLQDVLKLTFQIEDFINR